MTIGATLTAADRHDVSSFEAEAWSFATEIRRAAARLVNDPSEAEDLVQEVFLQAWESFGDYQLGTNCRAWLYRILFFKAGHLRRRRRAEALRKVEIDFAVDRMVAVEANNELMDAGIVRAIRNLPDDFRNVVMLADLEDRDYREIAGLLGIPIGTVMSRLNRGRARLRLSLSRVAREYGIGSHSQLQGNSTAVRFARAS